MIPDFFKKQLLRMILVIFLVGEGIPPASRLVAATTQNLGAGQPRTIEAAGTEEDPVSLEKRLRLKKVVISATRTETQLADSVVQVEVISKEDIRNRGARTVSDVLNNQPGFFIQRSAVSGENIQIQGLDSTYLLILRDGERLNGRLNGGNYDLSRLRVENIERIEIVRGSSSAVYGADAIAGVVNIVTRRPDKPRAEVRMQAGNMGAFDTAAALALPLAEKFGLKAAGGYRTQQPFRYNSDAVQTDGRGLVDYSGEAGFEYAFAQNWVAAVQGDYQRRRLWGIDTPETGGVFDRTNLTETAQTAFRVHTRRDDSDQAQSAAQTTQRDDAKLRKELTQKYTQADFRLNGSYTRFRDQYLYDQRNDTVQDKYEQTNENTYAIHGQAALPLFSAGRLTLGAEGFFEDLTTPRIIPGFVKRNRISGYSQFETRLGEGFVITPGVRYDRDSQFGDYVSPRFGVKWGNEDFIVRASVGMGYRAPSFRELYLYFENPTFGYRVDGNARLNAESSKSANLGAEAYLTKRLSIDSNAYYNEITNLIQTSTASLNPLVYQYRNVASALTTGIDNRLIYYYNRYLRFSLGYSLTYAYDVGAQRLLPGRALHRGTVGLLLRYKSLMFRALTAIHDRMPYYLTDTAKTPDYYTAVFATVDLNMEYVFSHGFSLYAGGENLNSAGDSRYLPLAPARVYGGVRYIFGE